MAIVYLGFGSNKGNRPENIEKAMRLVDELESTRIIKESSMYETEPWGKASSVNYFNNAVMIETNLEAAELLKSLKAIEVKAGRTISDKWSDREIDIDLLFYKNDVYTNEKLNVPHPEIENRKFVLIPMSEISPEFMHPVLKKTIRELLSETKDNLKVSKLEFSKTSKE